MDRRTSPPAEPDCAEVVGRITDYMEGALGSSDLERFETHTADCPDCGKALERMREIVRVARSLRPEPLDPESRGRLMAHFREWASRR